MSKQENKLSDERREELRGLFTLGLMAVLITLRVTQTEITFYLLGQVYIMTGIIDAALMLWGLYAFLMVIWLSNDWLPKKICIIAYAFGTSMLILSFALFYFTLIAIFSVISMPWHLITYLLLIPLFYLLAKGIIQAIKALRLSFKAIFNSLSS
jgi:hypothetical protein